MAIAVGAAWIATAVLLNRPAATVECVAALAAALGAVLLIASRRGGHRMASWAFVLLMIALVLLPLGGRIARFRASPLAQLAAAHGAVTADLTVSGDPEPVAARGVSGSPRVSVSAAANAVLAGGQRVALHGAVLVISPATGWQTVLPGQHVRITGILEPALDARRLGVVLVADSPPVLTRSPPWWQRGAGAVRQSFRAVCASLPGDLAGLLPGLVDGDTSRLDPVLREHFRTAGLTHLVAVSGMNCSILVGAVLLCLHRCGARPWLRAGIGVLVIVAFVVVARPSPSVLRAAAMAALAMVALAIGRPRQAVAALSVSVLVLLLWQPALAASAGFTMSVLATAALLVIAPQWADGLRRRRWPAGCAELVAAAAAAHACSAPVIAAISGRVSLVAIPANVLAEPVVAMATVVGFVAAALSPLSAGVAGAAAQLAALPCRWLVWVANYFGQLPGATLPWPSGARGAFALAAALVVALALARCAGARRAMIAAVLVAVAIQIPVRTATAGWPAAGWIFVACDVGQGDALVIRTASADAVVVDTGPDPVAVDRCLHDLGIIRIRLLVLTHFHLDHIGGIAGAARGRRIDSVWTSPLADPVSGVRAVGDVLGQRGVHTRAVTAGASIDVGPVHLDVLGPAAAFHHTRSDPNNSSIVVRAEVGGRALLLTGDAEVEAQQAMLAAGVDPRADVMKVPHHGSAHSSQAFLDAVHAELDLISVGRGNDYGLPAPSLLGLLARTGATVRRTDQDGDLAVTLRSGTLKAVSRGRSATVAGGRLVPRRRPANVPLRPSAPVSWVDVWPAWAASVAPARMGPCRSVQSRSMTCRLIHRRASSLSVTRSCWWVVRLPRSPPRCGGVMRTWSRPNVPAARSTAQSCTKCWGHPCSATRAC